MRRTSNQSDFMILFVIVIIIWIIVGIYHLVRSSESLSAYELTKGRPNSEDPNVRRLLAGDLQREDYGTIRFSGGGTQSVLEQANQWFADNPHVYGIRAEFDTAKLPGAATFCWASLVCLTVRYKVSANVNRRQYAAVEIKKYGVLSLLGGEDSAMSEWLSNNPGASFVDRSQVFKSYTNQGSSIIQVFAIAAMDAPARRISEKREPVIAAPASAPAAESSTESKSEIKTALEQASDKNIQKPEETTRREKKTKWILILPTISLFLAGICGAVYEYFIEFL